MSENHVHPLNDLHPHTLEGFGCACEPTVKYIQGSYLVIHNAYDHREIVEQAVDILNGDNQEIGPAGNEP